MMHFELAPDYERIIPDEYQDSAEMQLIRLFHTLTYRFAGAFTAGRDVLDYGCGSGYGSASIAESARSVKAVDVAPDAIAYGRAHYARQNLEFQVIKPGDALPFADRAFDSVLSHQVIEHVSSPDAYLHEVVRVLRPRGVLVLATPDRRTRLLPFQRPWNRWHLTEYSQRSLHRLLTAHFPEVELFTMGGEPSVLDIELRRTRRLKWASLPFTLPLVPDALRVRVIAAVNALSSFRRARRRPPARKQAGAGGALREDAISIGKGCWPSVNLIAVARRSA